MIQKKISEGIDCPKCSSNHTKMQGKYPNGKQRYQCIDCKCIYQGEDREKRHYVPALHGYSVGRKKVRLPGEYVEEDD